MLVHVGKDDAWGNPPGEQAAFDAAKSVCDFLHAPNNLTVYMATTATTTPTAPKAPIPGKPP